MNAGSGESAFGYVDECCWRDGGKRGGVVLLSGDLLSCSLALTSFSISTGRTAQTWSLIGIMADSAQERKRQGQLEKKRQEMLAGYAEQRAALSAEASRDHTSAERFVKRTEGVEERMKRSTVGLVHAQDFKRIREELEEENRRKAAQTDDIQQDDKKRKKKKDKKSKMLSFGGDDEEDEATAAAEEEGACGSSWRHSGCFATS